jgi:dTDP-4-amino-4,6-dideoxygalactose transaminase
MYKDYYRKLPITESVWKNLVTLPLYPDLEEEDFQLIIKTIRDFYLK